MAVGFVTFMAKGIAAYGASMVAQMIAGAFEEDPETPVTDDKPTTLSSRGDYIPYIIGKDRVGAFFGWAGNRVFEPGKPAKGGKGGYSEGTQDVYYEDGLHFLCIGPGYSLSKIWFNGEVVFDTVLKASEQPDGSQHSTDALDDDDNFPRGNFRIYWGHKDGGAVDTLLANQTDLDSTFPGVMHIVWDQLRLGGSATWPLIEYEVEVRPFRATHTRSVDWDDADNIFDPSVKDWLDTAFGPDDANPDDLLAFDNSLVSATQLLIAGDVETEYNTIVAAGERLTIQDSSTSVANGTYKVMSANYNSGRTAVGMDDLAENSIDALSGWTAADDVFNDGPGTFYGLGTVDLYEVYDFGFGTYSTSVSEDPGGSFHFKPYQQIEVYLKALPLDATSSSVKIVFENPTSGDEHWCQLTTTDGGDSWTKTTSGGANGGAKQLASGWFLYGSYTLGDGTTNTDTLQDITFRVDFSTTGATVGSTGNSLNGDKRRDESFQLVSPKFLSQEFLTVFGVTEVLLDRLIPNIPEEPFGDGSIIPWVSGLGPQGPNPASVLHQLLFAPYPNGANLDPSDFHVDFDASSGEPQIAYNQTLRQLAEIAENYEPLNAHLRVPGGETFSDTVDRLLLDLGWMISWDPTLGKFVFTNLRDPQDAIISGSGIPYEVPNRLLGDFAPETEVLLDTSTTTSRTSYSYIDVERNYKKDNVVMSDDASIVDEGVSRQNNVDLFIPRDRYTAEKVAVRRAQLDLESPALVDFEISGEGQRMYPGMPFTITYTGDEDIDLDFSPEDIFRVLEAQVRQDTGTCKIRAIFDSYSLREVEDAATSNLDVSLGTGGTDPSLPVADLAVAIVEVPASISDQPRTFSVLRIRDNVRVRSAIINVSSDGTSYDLLTSQSFTATGGTLMEEWDDTQGNTLNGPLIRALGPDINRLSRNLSEADFQNGRQVAVINDEWFYVKSLTAVDEGVYRLTKLHRAKFGTAKGNHSFGDTVFIFDPAALPKYKDVRAVGGQTLYVKASAVAATAVPLDQTITTSKTLQGVTGPMGVTIHAGDETDLQATYKAADHVSTSVLLRNSTTGQWEEYYSDGSSWSLVGGGSGGVNSLIIGAPQQFNPDAQGVIDDSDTFLLSGTGQVSIVTLNGQVLDDDEYTQDGTTLTVSPDAGFNATTDEILVFQPVVSPSTGSPNGFLFYDHNGSSVSLTADTWTDVPNDGAGANTVLTYAPGGVSDMLDEANGYLDFTELPLGAQVWARNDVTINPDVNDALLELRYVMGTGVDEYTIPVLSERLDDGASVDYRRVVSSLLHLADSNTRDNPGKLQVRLSSSGTLSSPEVYLNVQLQTVPTDTVKAGFLNYEDASADVTITADTWTDVPNDGAGADTTTAYAPVGVTDLLNESTGYLNFSELSLGDQLILRTDVSVTPLVNDALFEMRVVLGTGVDEYTLPIMSQRLDAGASTTYEFAPSVQVPMLDSNTQGNVGKIQFRLSSGGTFSNSGISINVQRR